MSNTEQHTGVVKFFNETKGFGFIKSDIDDQEYFVHATGLKERTRIKENDKVSFFLKEGRKGMNCTGVAHN